MPVTTAKQKVALIVFGLILGLALLEVMLRIGGFIFTSFQERANLCSLQKKDSYVIMCLGESTTALGGEYAYPRQLEEVLNETDIGVKFSVLNKGIPGTTTTEIVSLLEYNLNTYEPDMVTAMIGINEAFEIGDYENTRPAKVKLFFRGFRTYKLAKLLWEHIVYKVREMKRSFFSEREEGGNEPLLELESQAVNAGSYESYVELALSYRYHWECEKAEETFKKAIAINPDIDTAYTELGEMYIWLEREQEAEEMCIKAIEVNPENDVAYGDLAWLREVKGKLSEAEELYKKAFGLNPHNNFAFSHLVARYMEKRRFKKAEELCQKVIEVNPRNDQAWGALAHCYQKEGKLNLAKEYFQKAVELRSLYYHPLVMRNYQRLKEIVTGRNIPLVCVQYPMRKLEHLKRMLPDQSGIVFVDNEKIFKEAVRRDGYKEYFMDNFAGDFGHCNAKGHRLLAENIAAAIFGEVFDIKPEKNFRHEVR